MIDLNNKKELEKYKGPIDKNLKVSQKKLYLDLSDINKSVAFVEKIKNEPRSKKLYSQNL